ncbi:MAG: SUMF1/EgtB/PvdO family nonheme iron enzyme [Halioglobus sp.]|nr:SUMF1/EgtB/PvdO family nonheme iron enzyme [Halioglobus sp.]
MKQAFHLLHPYILLCLLAASALAEDFAPYSEPVPGTDVAISMLPVHGGKAMIGSSGSEPGHRASEAPRHEVSLDDFWMGQFEITWQQYAVFVHRGDTFDQLVPAQQLEQLAIDGVTGASSPYTISGPSDPDVRNHPATHITQYAALRYARWLSAKTGHFYRLPTEAEWEYACRAGTATPWSFGEDPARAGDFAVFSGNSDESTAATGSRKPNPWQLHDMHGNAAEWTMDQYDPDYYASSPADNPWNRPTSLYPRVVRGGSFVDGVESMRCAARMPSSPAWKTSDPQFPKSQWWFTDAPFIGFRLVRPRVQPPAEVIGNYWLQAIEDFGE